MSKNKATSDQSDERADSASEDATFDETDLDDMDAGDNDADSDEPAALTAAAAGMPQKRNGAFVAWLALFREMAVSRFDTLPPLPA